MFYLSARWKPGGGKLSRRGSARQLLTAAGGSERCGGAGPGRSEPGPCCALGGGCLGVLAPRRAREGKRPLPGGERACKQRDQTALFSSSKKPPLFLFLSLSFSLPPPPPHLFFLFFFPPPPGISPSPSAIAFPITQLVLFTHPPQSLPGSVARVLLLGCPSPERDRAVPSQRVPAVHGPGYSWLADSAFLLYTFPARI